MAHSKDSAQSDPEEWAQLLQSEPELGYAGYRLTETKKINVLLVGRSQAGKSTIVDSLVRPTRGVTATGLSVTKDPTFRTLVLSSKDQLYQINFLDTPGLREVRASKSEMRSDKELLELMVRCIEENITTINVVCLVSAAGQTALTDVEPFQALIEFLGPSFADNTMMVLTHCDSFPPKKLLEFEETIRKADVTRPIYEFCKLGFCRYGALSSDTLRNFDDGEEDDSAMRLQVLRKTLRKIESFRSDFLTRLLSCADDPKKVMILDHILRATDERRKLMIVEVARKMKTDPSTEQNAVLTTLQQQHAEAEAKLAKEQAEELNRLKAASISVSDSFDQPKDISDKQTEDNAVAAAMAKHVECIRAMRLRHQKEKEELKRNMKKLANDKDFNCNLM